MTHTLAETQTTTIGLIVYQFIDVYARRRVRHTHTHKISRSLYCTNKLAVCIQIITIISPISTIITDNADEQIANVDDVDVYRCVESISA